MPLCSHAGFTVANYFGGGELPLFFFRVSMKSSGNLLEINAQLYCLCLLQPQVRDNSMRWLVWLWTRTAESDPYINMLSLIFGFFCI